MLAELAAANAAFAVIKGALANGKELSALGGRVFDYFDNKAKIQEKATNKGGGSDMEEFMALEQLKAQEEHLRESMVYAGRAGMWDDWVKFQAAAARRRREQKEAAARAERQHADNLHAARLEAEALGVCFLTACESMGVNPETGAPVEPEGKQRYSGPMLALVAARKAYTKAANGNPCCADGLAAMCGAYPREVVVAGLIVALKLPGNPYLALNPGQQSMNLRNKARHALKSGFIQPSEIAAALVACSNKG